MQQMLTIFALAFVAFVGFVIYFIFKILQFVLTATNLYKKMINRQEALIDLLIDIRDNTKKYDTAKISASDKKLVESFASAEAGDGSTQVNVPKNGWKCACGHVNQPFFELCQSCRVKQEVP